MRVLFTQENDAYFNMAIDDAIFSHYPILEVPTLHFYAWSTSAVTIGRNQSLKEINKDYCDSQGIDVVRRITGGRALHHEKCISFSIVDTSKKNERELYRMYGEFIVQALHGLNIDATFVPPCDITVNSNIIAEIGIVKNDSVHLMQATLFLDHNIEEMLNIMTLLKEITRTGSKTDATQHLTSILKETGHAIPEQVYDVLQSALPGSCLVGSLTKEEVQIAQKRISEKYMNDDWLSLR